MIGPSPRLIFFFGVSNVVKIGLHMSFFPSDWATLADKWLFQRCRAPTLDLSSSISLSFSASWSLNSCPNFDRSSWKSFKNSWRSGGAVPESCLMAFRAASWDSLSDAFYCCFKIWIQPRPPIESQYGSALNASKQPISMVSANVQDELHLLFAGN